MLSTTKNLKETLEAIKNAIAKKFKDRVAAVEIFDPEADEQKVPAIILDLEQMNEGEDKGDERFPLECSLIAYCLMSADTPHYLLVSKDFAAELMKLVRQNNWNFKNTSLPEALEASPATFKPSRAGYECWAITWNQTFYYGENIWESDLPVPSTIKFSWEPEIGTEHEGDYEQLSNN